MFFSTARVLAILELLQTHGRMRGEELAARLEVDVRTIRRYVMILRDQGYPVEMQRGRHGGYHLGPRFQLPLTLTEREALAVTCSLLSMRQQRLACVADDGGQALTKLMRALPSSTRAFAQNIEQAVTFALPYMTVDEPCDVADLERIVQAVRAHQRVRLRYRAHGGEESERLVDPYHVVNRTGRWYLVGYCHLRADQRVFRLDHITHVVALTATFAPPAIDAVAAVEQAIAQVPWRWEYVVHVDLSLAEAQHRIPATIADLEEQEQGVRMHGFAEDLHWLAYVLAGLRCPLVVLSPPELRTHLRALAEHIQAIALFPPSC